MMRLSLLVVPWKELVGGSVGQQGKLMMKREQATSGTLSTMPLVVRGDGTLFVESGELGKAFSCGDPCYNLTSSSIVSTLR